jgi:hypothetical protein
LTANASSGNREARRVLNKLQEIEFVLERAGEHLDWLRKRVRHPDPDLTPDDDRRILEESFDHYAGDIRIRIGECAGSLRNALNYLMCVFAEQDWKSVGKQVQFPIEDTPKDFASKRCRHGYLKGISDEHVARIENFQPYYAGNWVKDLQVLSNWYRHSGLIKVQKQFQRPKSVASPSRAGITGVDVNSEFFAAVSLEDGRPVVETLEEIERSVRAAIDELKLLLPGYLSDLT